MADEQERRDNLADQADQGKGSGISRRRFLQAAAVTALGATGLAGLVGCSGGAAPSPTAKPAAGATPAAAGAAGSAPNISKKVSITYWTVLDHKDTKTPRSKAEIAMVDLFRKKYPNIEVNVQTVPWQKIVEQVIQSAGAGKSPDVAMVSDRGLTTLYKAGAIQALGDYVGKAWTPEQKADWVLPQKNASIDGKWMGVYWHTLIGNMLYANKALLDAKSVQVPKDWDETAKIGKTLTEGRVAGYLMGASKDGDAVQLTNWLIPALWAAGADWLDDKWHVAFNNDKGAKPFQWLYDMVYTYQIMPPGMVSITRDNMLDSFNAGTVAMTTLGSNTVASARSGAAGKNMILTLDPGPNTGKPSPAQSSGKWLIMGKDCKEKEATGLFIEEEVSPEAQVINAKIAAEIPSRKSVLKDPWFSTPEAADMKFMVEYVQQHGQTMPYHEKHLMLSDMVADAVQAIVAKQKSVKDALNDLAKAWDAENKA
ncbi:MAG: extracellular solute-binding protein [Chloroflexi bacterium]|nr:extracellular solute-binding protein [Chloroflexota bacterium]